jgi:hypothetical protein
MEQSQWAFDEWAFEMSCWSWLVGFIAFSSVGIVTKYGAKYGAKADLFDPIL